MVYLVIISIMCFVLGGALTYCLTSYFQKKALRKLQNFQNVAVNGKFSDFSSNPGLQDKILKDFMKGVENK